MSTLIQELQKASTDSSISTSELLRKALVCAKKLNAKEFEEWIRKEQKGYTDSDEIPEYRNVPGRLMATNPVHGLVPIQFEDPDTQELVSKKYLAESINYIEELVKGEKEIAMPLPRFKKFLSTADGYSPDAEIYFFATKSYVKSILETIRDTILNWSLKLEEDGLTGDDYKFTNDEKEIAASTTYHVENFIQVENMNNSQIQQGTKGSQQTQEISAQAEEALNKFLNNFKNELAQLEIEEPRKQLIESDLQAMQNSLEEGQKEKNYFLKKLGSLKAILEGAAGNLLAEGVASKIPEIIALIAAG